MSIKVIISNGSYKFHLSVLASELAAREMLEIFITAGYPKKSLFKYLNKFSHKSFVARLIDRRENIPDSKIRSFLSTELFFKTGDIFFAKYSTLIQQLIHSLGFKFYQFLVLFEILKSNAEIYHYRNCYGGFSVKLAKYKGMISICDHSIAHPALISYFIKNKGAWPPIANDEQLTQSMSVLEKNMFSDLSNKDHIIVNSDFVKATLQRLGMHESKIHVVYLGVDDAFLSSVEEKDNSTITNTILYAGGWQKRKGVYDLLEAIDHSDFDCKLEIAGGADEELIADKKMKSFLASDKVEWHGIVPRKQLARLMSKHKIFIFPSYCEGSARVIFEAMAAGLFIITTKNSGSIVEDGIHGLIVEPGNPNSLKNAIKYAINNPDLVSRVGIKNSELIKQKYTQDKYCDNILNIYQSIRSLSKE